VTAVRHRQGCILAPMLFILGLDSVMQLWSADERDHLTVSHRKYHNMQTKLASDIARCAKKNWCGDERANKERNLSKRH
jgi:hypothetical protein